MIRRKTRADTAPAWAEDSSPSRVDRIEELIASDGWEPVKGACLRLLASPEQQTCWPDVLAVVWGAVLDNRSLPENHMIALLYRCLRIRPQLDENLIWSITSKIKKVGYLSQYDPLSDPDIVSIMRSWDN